MVCCEVKHSPPFLCITYRLYISRLPNTAYAVCLLYTECLKSISRVNTVFTLMAAAEFLICFGVRMDQLKKLNSHVNYQYTCTAHWYNTVPHSICTLPVHWNSIYRYVHIEYSAQLQHIHEQNNTPLQLTCAFSDCLEETRLLVEDFEEHIFFGGGDNSISVSEDSRPDISNLLRER